MAKPKSMHVILGFSDFGKLISHLGKISVNMLS